jgi:hypothetical protein
MFLRGFFPCQDLLETLINGQDLNERYLENTASFKYCASQHQWGIDFGVYILGSSTRATTQASLDTQFSLEKYRIY